MEERVILHSDINSCYASIEHLHRPELAKEPLAVGGDPQSRHGIILTADIMAKKAGVKTGMALWEARQVCPELIIVPPRMELYLRFSRLAHNIYAEYTPYVEPYGIDESWLDVTQTVHMKGSGEKIAQEIRKRMKEELGITVSIGVSFNKIFAKLGSDMKKPDAVTTLYRGEYREKAWKLPVGDLLYVGKSTEKKLNRLDIHTIGDLACIDVNILKAHLGKMGQILHAFANGQDDSPVRPDGEHGIIKSIGNSTTTPRDLINDTDVSIIIYALAESVAARLRDSGLRCQVIEISIRDTDLYSFTRQRKLPMPTDITDEIAKAAIALFRQQYTWDKPIRSIGIRGAQLTGTNSYEQYSMFCDPDYRNKQMKADHAVDEIRSRFGYYSIQRGIMYQDKSLSAVNAKEDHVVHPHGYFG